MVLLEYKAHSFGKAIAYVARIGKPHALCKSRCQRPAAVALHRTNMTQYDEIRIAGGDTATPLSLAKRLRLIEEVCDLPNVKFLDCGCGAGEYVFALREKYGTDAWGIEFLEDKVAKAKENPRYALCVKQGDLEGLDEPDATYDVGLLNEVLEHVPNESQALAEVYRVLKPGGRVIVFSPNRFFPFETHGVHLRGKGTKISPGFPLIPYLPLPVGKIFFDYWARNYWPHQLQGMVRAAGFTICRLDYFWQTFENISGRQPYLVRKFKGMFRSVAATCEKTPLIRRMGVSQVIVGLKAS